MKHLRVTATIDEDDVPPFYAMLAHSPEVRETRVLELNTTLEDRETVLFAIDGDAEQFAELTLETQGIESVVLSASEGSWTYALVEMRTHATPVFGGIEAAPDSLDIQVEEIGTLGSGVGEAAARLSERQREAVADELGVAPPTASEHLQKAEAKCMRAMVEEFGPEL